MTSRVAAVTFRFPVRLAPAAQRVAVVGPFNHWNPEVHPLSRGGDGDWETVVYLPPGRIIYNFWVDGAMWVDPRDDGRLPNAWGAEYSVRYVYPTMTPYPVASG